MGTPLPRPAGESHHNQATKVSHLRCMVRRHGLCSWLGVGCALAGTAAGTRVGKARAEIHSGREAEHDKTFEQTRVHNVEEMVPGCTARDRNASSRARLVPY